MKMLQVLSFSLHLHMKEINCEIVRWIYLLIYMWKVKLALNTTPPPPLIPTLHLNNILFIDTHI